MAANVTLAIAHLDTLRAKLAKGCGLVCIHYAVEMVPGPPGDAWVDMLGGHFEINWSVNPHWVADFKTLPEHPTTRGVQPFATNDEWYFHMRFKDSDKVIPILAAVAPEETMRRKDGAHSGNPGGSQECRGRRKANGRLGVRATRRRTFVRVHRRPLPLELGSR